VVATVDDYALAHPIFSTVMAESSGKAAPNNVTAVVKLITERTKAPAVKPTGMTFAAPAAKPAAPAAKPFARVEVAGHASEVVISSDEIGTALGIGRSSAHRAVRTALDRGFLINNEMRHGRPFKLVLKKGVDEAITSLLPDPRAITQEGGA
jgi:hypothetical protein